jgi:ankyrin repeat protein
LQRRLNDWLKAASALLLLSLFISPRSLTISPLPSLTLVANASQRRLNDWLKAASGAGYPWLVERLLERGGQPNTICTGNVTPLMSAVMSGKLRVAEMLLRHCSDPLGAINRQRDDGTTPINLAAGAGQAAAVQWLIDNGADVNLIQVGGSATHVSDTTGGAWRAKGGCHRHCQHHPSRARGGRAVAD